MLGTVDPKSSIHCKGVFGIKADEMSPSMDKYTDLIYDSLSEYYMNNIATRLFV